MAEATPNPASENAQAEPRDPEGIDAAAEAFASQGQQAQPEDEAEPAQEPADESDTEAVEADPEAEEPAEELVEVEYEGKTYSLPPVLQGAFLRQSDYSRSMNEVKAKEQTLTQRLEQIDALADGAEKYAEALAEVRAIEAQLASMDAVDWEALSIENPAQASRLAVQQLRAQQAWQKATAKATGIGDEQKSSRQKLLNEARADMDKALKKDLPGWGDELGTKLTKYATEKGVQLKTLSALTDPAMVVALDKARRFDELQASKTAIKAKAQAAPQVTKPGAPRKADPKVDAMARLRKSNSIDDAAAAFLAVGR